VTTWLSHCTILEGHAPITGVVFTVTLNEHVELPQIFVAVQFTVVVPVANVDPDAGIQLIDAVGVPDADGVEYVTV